MAVAQGLHVFIGMVFIASPHVKPVMYPLPNIYQLESGCTNAVTKELREYSVLFKKAKEHSAILLGQCVAIPDAVL